MVTSLKYYFYVVGIYDAKGVTDCNTSAIVFNIQFQLVFQDNGTCDLNSLRHFVMYTAART